MQLSLFYFLIVQKIKLALTIVRLRIIFNSGEKEILRKRFGDAAEKFTEVERLYPYSDWAKRALIMQVYSFHKDQSYENVVSAANRFIEFHPNDKDVPYAYYLIGLSYYDQVLAIGRDQELAKEALRVFSLITKEYPESKYASSSQIRFNFLRDHLASKEMEVGRYYLKRSHYQHHRLWRSKQHVSPRVPKAVEVGLRTA